MLWWWLTSIQAENGSEETTGRASKQQLVLGHAAEGALTKAHRKLPGYTCSPLSQPAGLKLRRRLPMLSSNSTSDSLGWMCRTHRSPSCVGTCSQAVFARVNFKFTQAWIHPAHPVMLKLPVMDT